MKKIVLISCVSKKKEYKTKAQELYGSTLFKYSLSYGRSLNPDKIFILSALHGLVELDQEIEPYNVTLTNLAKKERVQWGKKVIEQLKNHSDIKNDTFIILAGKLYSDPIEDYLENIEYPLVGLKIGERLSFLKNGLKNDNSNC
ncbi:MAG: DUF6884 domain-containing protein [Treponemataceae bacterium]